jgi:hypothetical protein
MAARASALDFSMRSGSCRMPPTLTRRKVLPWSTYNAPEIALPTQYASSPIPGMVRGLPKPSSCSDSFSFGPEGWNCFLQNSRGVSLGLAVGFAVATATLTDFAEAAMPKKHWDINRLLPGWVLLLVSLTDSPKTEAISALVRSVQGSWGALELFWAGASAGTRRVHSRMLRKKFFAKLFPFWSSSPGFIFEIYGTAETVPLQDSEQELIPINKLVGGKRNLYIVPTGLALISRSPSTYVLGSIIPPFWGWFHYSADVLEFLK